MPTIQARGLTKRFGADVLAVDHLDFDAIPGGVTGFLGPNGAGKTTTLRMVLGLVTPTSGTVLVDGLRYRDLPHPTNRVGASLEASGFHPARTARNHLKIIATMAGLPFSRVEECLDLVGLSEVGDRKVGGFSLGMRQRLELARSLLGKPDILVLDEPANGLDPQGIAWLRDFLRFYATEKAPSAGDGRIVIVSSHLLSEAQLIVDDVIVLNAGRLAAQGRLSDLLAGTKRSVRVRTPDADRLVQALRAANLPAVMQDGYVVCEGVTPEQVGPVMVENRIEVHEMESSTESLESLFFSLTGGESAQPGPTAPMGDYRRFNDGPAAPSAPPPAVVSAAPSPAAGPATDGSAAGSATAGPAAGSAAAGSEAPPAPSPAAGPRPGGGQT
ncbi:MAG: ATP-binding cassette domain-containing protein [Acidimicrobiales bacterium]|jgi:ABC-2 type transport system ATP-binding protein